MLGAWIPDIGLSDCCLFIILIVLLILEGSQLFFKIQWEKESLAAESTSSSNILDVDQDWQDKEALVNIINFQEKNRRCLEEMDKRLENLNMFFERTKMDFEQELGNLCEPQHSRDSPYGSLLRPYPEGHPSIPALRERVEQVCFKIGLIKEILMEMRDSPSHVDIISNLERRIGRIECEIQKRNSAHERLL